MKKKPLATSLITLLLTGLFTILLGSAIQPGFPVVHASSSNVADATQLFHEKGCEYCHGVNGIGVPGKGPSLLTVGKRLKKKAIERQIHDGGNVMPAFGDVLQPDEISALVNMLAKKKKAPKTLSARSPAAF